MAEEKIRYYLGLGSNLDDRFLMLKRCREELTAAGLAIQHGSSIYETEPVGCSGQIWYLNQVVEIESDLHPAQLLERVKQIEKRMGRLPAPRNEPRIIDIDILLAEAWVIKTQKLEIPHPRLEKRNFVLVPLNEIAPYVCHPVLGQSIAKLLEECTDTSKYKLYLANGF